MKHNIKLRDWKHKQPVKQVAPGTRDENGRFVKGSSGNPNGRPRGETLSEAIRAKLKEGVNGRVDITWAELIADVMIQEATAKRNSKAWAEIRELTETKKIDLNISWQAEIEHLILTGQLTPEQAREVIGDDSLTAELFNRPSLVTIDHRPGEVKSGAD